MFGNKKSPKNPGNGKSKYSKTIVLIGPKGVGKTTLASKYKNPADNEIHEATIGMAFVIKKMERAGKTFNHEEPDTHWTLNIWDTAGDQRFQNLLQSGIKASASCLFVIDPSITNFSEHQQYITDVVNTHKNLLSTGNTLHALVVTKSDPGEEKLSKDENEDKKADLDPLVPHSHMRNIHKFAKEISETLKLENTMPIFVCSAINNLGVNEIFDWMIDQFEAELEQTLHAQYSPSFHSPKKGGEQKMGLLEVEEGLEEKEGSPKKGKGSNCCRCSMM